MLPLVLLRILIIPRITTALGLVLITTAEVDNGFILLDELL